MTLHRDAAHISPMKLPASFDHTAVLDATLTDILAARGIPFDRLSAAKKFEMRENLLPVLNAMAPHIQAQLQAATETKSAETFVVPDTLEGLLP